MGLHQFSVIRNVKTRYDFQIPLANWAAGVSVCMCACMRVCVCVRWGRACVLAFDFV